MSARTRSPAPSLPAASDTTPAAVPPASMTPAEHPQSTATTPRPGSVAGGDDAQQQVLQPLTPDSAGASAADCDEQAPLSLRALVTTKEAGLVIGKAGKNVSEIRAVSGAKVTISEMVPGAVERVLTVTGPLSTVAKAFALVAHKFLEELPDNNQENVSVRPTAIRLLLPHSRMGSVIGKGGSKIRDIQETSGARLIASVDKLPCSTERVVTVTGVPDSIHIAVYHIGEILRRFLDRAPNYQPYKPMARFDSAATGMQGDELYGGPFAGAPQQQPPIAPQFVGGYLSQLGGQTAPGPYSNRASGPIGSGGVGSGMTAAGGARTVQPGTQVQHIFIPNDMVGCVIGRQGSSINEIRNLSKTHIKIGETYPGSNERMVTITGAPEHNQIAIYLLYKKLESEKQRAMSLNQTGGLSSDANLNIGGPGGVESSYYGGEMMPAAAPSPLQHSDRGRVPPNQ